MAYGPHSLVFYSRLAPLADPAFDALGPPPFDAVEVGSTIKFPSPIVWTVLDDGTLDPRRCGAKVLSSGLLLRHGKRKVELAHVTGVTRGTSPQSFRDPPLPPAQAASLESLSFTLVLDTDRSAEPYCIFLLLDSEAFEDFDAWIGDLLALQRRRFPPLRAAPPP